MLEPGQPSRSIVRLAVGFEGGLALLALALGWFMQPQPLEQLHFNLAGILWGIGATVPLLALLALSRKYPLGPLRELKRLMDELLIPLFAGCTWKDFAVIAALAGLGEELLFRCVVQSAFEGWWGSWVGLIGAAVLFGLAHAITPLYTLLAGLIGLYMGWLWRVSGELLAPIVAHGLYDFIALLALTRNTATVPAPLELPLQDPENLPQV